MAEDPSAVERLNSTGSYRRGMVSDLLSRGMRGSSMSESKMPAQILEDQSWPA